MGYRCVYLLLGLWSLVIMALSGQHGTLVSAGASEALGGSTSGVVTVESTKKVLYDITASPSGSIYLRTLSATVDARDSPYVITTSLPRSGIFSSNKSATSLAQGTKKSPDNVVTSSGLSKSAATLADSTNKLPDDIATSMSKSETFPLNKPATTLARGTNKSLDSVLTSMSKSGIFPSNKPVTSTTSMSTPSSYFTAKSLPGSRTSSTQKPVETTMVENTSARPTSEENETREGTHSTDHIILHLISYFGVGISIVALFLAFLTFICLRFKKTEHHFIHANFALSLIFAEALFLFGVQRMEYQMACKVIAIALHYLFLVAFCWMALEGVMLYLILVKVFQTNIPLRRRKTIFFLCGWGIPGVFVGVTTTLLYEEYGTNDFCWLSVHSNVIWALIGPVLLVCLFNFTCLVKTFCVMAERRRLNQNRDRVSEIRFWAKGCAVLSCLLGITWMLGVFVVNESTAFMVYLFNVFNTLQGVLIFLLHCLGDDKIRAEYISIFHCGKRRAAYGLVRQCSKTDIEPNNKNAGKFSKEQETMETKTNPEPPKDATLESGHLAVCRRSLQGSADKRVSTASGNHKRVSTTSGDHNRVSQELGGSTRQSRELWASSWIHVEEEPQASFAMDVFSTLKGDGCGDLQVVESDTTINDHQIGFPLTQNGFKSFKIAGVKKQEDAGQGRDSRILKLYEEEIPPAVSDS